MDHRADKLKELYSIVSKHSNYQILADCLNPYCSSSELKVKSRYEKERLKFFTSKLDFISKKVLDIGGNTGFFSIELCNRYNSEIDFFEGNKVHADFVDCAVRLLGVEDRIQVHEEYYLFDDSQVNENYYDISLLLNVLHHIGDDYGNSNLSIDLAKKEMLKNLNYLSGKSEYLVFQMGYCWKGNRDLLLFTEGTKNQMINFIKEGTEKYWQIEAIGIAEFKDNAITYKQPNENNILRNDAMGEFLNRPIFVMKSIV